MIYFSIGFTKVTSLRASVPFDEPESWLLVQKAIAHMPHLEILRLVWRAEGPSLTEICRMNLPKLKTLELRRPRKGPDNNIFPVVGLILLVQSSLS
jgi:hypothetical protein